MNNNYRRGRRPQFPRRKMTYNQLIAQQNNKRNRKMRIPMRKPVVRRNPPARFNRTMVFSNRAYNPGASQPGTSNNNRRRPRPIVKKTSISPAGEGFLKCAFAPPDFTSTGVVGIPDNFRGRTLLKRHRLTYQAALTSGSDYYFLLLPVPGASYFGLSTTTGISNTSNWSATMYPDYPTIFGDASTASNQVSSFRHVSNHFELVCNSNQTTWSGSITAHKLPSQVIRKTTMATLADVLTITNLDAAQTLTGDLYCGTAQQGVYVAAYNMGEDFSFQPILENTVAIPNVVGTGDYGRISSANGIYGFDNNFETVVIRVAGLTANMAVTIRTWACVEYRISPSSALYEYSTFSPAYDEMAMRVYRETILSLPVAVPVSMNSDFWNRVLKIVRSLTAYGSLIPGPIGMISTGANIAAGGLTEIMNS